MYQTSCKNDESFMSLDKWGISVLEVSKKASQRILLQTVDEEIIGGHEIILESSDKDL